MNGSRFGVASSNKSGGFLIVCARGSFSLILQNERRLASFVTSAPCVVTTAPGSKTRKEKCDPVKWSSALHSKPKTSCFSRDCCGSAAFFAERLCLSVRPANYLPREAEPQGTGNVNGKPKAFLKGCGRAAKFSLVAPHISVICR